MKLAKVRRLEADPIRRRLNKRGFVRKDRRILESDDFVFIPLVDQFDTKFISEAGAEIIDGNAPERSHYRSPQEIIRDTIRIPDTLKDELPRKWEMVGDVLILRLPPNLRGFKKEIGEAYAGVLNARAVCLDRGLIAGVFREPQVEVIFGNGTETIHLENGILYKLDVAKTMFSSGNIDEKMRMSNLDCSGETIVDMFAGIGYFTLPLAVHAHANRLVACEINPIAYHYLLENIKLNSVQDIVRPVLGDNQELKGERCADRVLMGYVRTTKDHLPKAFSLVKTGGIIHYHDTFPLEVFPQKAIENLNEGAGDRHFQVLGQREVKSYSPGVSHMVLDVQVFD